MTTPNEVAGERAITVGGKPFALALRMETLAMLEAAFAVDSFEDVFARLGKKIAIDGDKAGEMIVQPIASELHKFWRVIVEVEGGRFPELAAAVETRPYALLAAALILRQSVFDDWFAGDRPAETTAPLEAAGAGANGSAAPAPLGYLPPNFGA